MLGITLEQVSDRLDRIAPQSPISQTPVAGFQVAFNSTTLGMTITFTLAQSAGIKTILLKRNSSKDIGSAVAINSWDAVALGDNQAVSYGDNDQAIKGLEQVFYWLECHPFQGANLVTVGPQTTPLTLDQEPPNSILDFDASRGAVSGGTVAIGVSFLPLAGDPRFDHVLITIAGYNGIAATVLIAESSTSPFSFQLEQTGETVTLTAIAVSQTGARSTGSAPTKVITLSAAASAPAKIIGATATEITTGLQITFPAGAESNITLYQIYRGPRGQGFAAASSIGTISPTGSSAYTFLDTGGLGGIFEWYVFAVNAIGNGAASAQILPDPASLTSADQPPNAPSNNTNLANVDSFDAGSSATIRIYGTGGAGSSWTRPTGFGPQTFAGGSITGKAYATTYYVVFDTVNKVYLAFTSPTQIVADNYAWAGKVLTVAAGGGGGSVGGGGGSDGGTGGELFGK